ncbi:filamentous hemagglutinin family domain-containing protein [Leptolyngbya sp. Heron Island J]|uniref:two-partner secretion domain-containing protein n=1 Tax=Leptolyngbya sp. Heron Island J TaxID=1385935 RepID=UPI0003B9783E|nr:filamentous hemagglutinin N-terminal domain-containing protein [Leptolyngbya sp. Heron Island J]ESA34052.1 filamentous hemagglutinin family domain-containing protein [Leptolyngbya sp. Heron Island J]
MNKYSLSFACLLTCSIAVPAQAQIVPDTTLGNENSILTPGVDVRGNVADLIEGGAERGSNLFHSFTDFNVNEGQRVYFVNPAEIESILSRVTGNDASDIFGTLGVDGSADLFLINPNGIVFGPDVSLDIEGSLYATTAEAVELGDEVFSATAPEQSQLLTINPSVSFWNYLTANSGDIVNRGSIAVGGDLVFASNNLDLEAQVAGAGDVSLLATDTLKIRDTTEVPFIGFAGENLLVQGNESVDIVALSHPDSGLFSYENMTLRSANPVEGDAHYFSGGSFRIEQSDSSLGRLLSPRDPIIQSLGDVEFDAYVGASLQVLAAGSVNIPTLIQITGADPIEGAIDEEFTLSNGAPFPVNGRIEPTLDIRAGIDPSAIEGNSIVGVGNFLDPFPIPVIPVFTNAPPTRADINLGSITMIDEVGNPLSGRVLLTNQHESNPNIAGNIALSATLFGVAVSSGDLLNGGDVAIDSKGRTTIDGSITTSAFPGFTPFIGNGGDIVTLSTEEIELLPGSSITAEGLVGGNITLSSDESIILNDSLIFSNGEAIDDALLEPGVVNIEAQNLRLLNGSAIATNTFGTIDAGDIDIKIEEEVEIVGIDQAFSGIQSNVGNGAVADGGDITLTAGSLLLSNTAQIQAIVRGQDSAPLPGQGDAGSITLNIDGPITIDSATGAIPSVIATTLGLGATGNGGKIQVNANSLSLLNGSGLTSRTQGQGSAGDIELIIQGPLILKENSGIETIVEAGAVGNGGEVFIDANSLEVLDNAVIQTFVRQAIDGLPDGQGDAGNIILDITDRALLSGDVLLISSVLENVEGDAGDIFFKAGSLTLENGADLLTATSGLGIGGKITINAEDSIVVRGNGSDQNRSAITSSAINPLSMNAGEIEVVTNTLSLENGGFISSATGGQGDAGRISINAGERVDIDGVAANPTLGNSGILSGTVSPGTGGDIEIKTGILSLTNGGEINAETENAGSAGSIIISAEQVSVQGIGLNGRPSTITTVARDGSTGEANNIIIRTDSIAIRDGATIATVTGGQGNAGDVQIQAEQDIFLDGESVVSAQNGQVFLSRSLIQTAAGSNSTGNAGMIDIDANSVKITNGAALSSITGSVGNAGNIDIYVDSSFVVSGSSSATGLPSGIVSGVAIGGAGQGGMLEIDADTIEISDSARLLSTTSFTGDAGDITLNAREAVLINGIGENGIASGVFSSAEPMAEGKGGTIRIFGPELSITDGASINAGSSGLGIAGSIELNILDKIRIDDGTISTTALTSSGGQIDIQAQGIFLRNDGDIATIVASGTGQGGDLTIVSDFIVALEDSDIVTFSVDGFGGAIDLSQTTLFSQNLNSASRASTLEEFLALDGNELVDINASGGLESGQITISDSTFIQNSLSELPDNLVSPEALVASSCIARSDNTASSFTLTGGDGLPQQPSSPQSPYSLSIVQPIIENDSELSISEPQQLYRLADGRLVMSRECR